MAGPLEWQFYVRLRGGSVYRIEGFLLKNGAMLPLFRFQYTAREKQFPRPHHTPGLCGFRQVNMRWRGDIYTHNHTYINQ